MTDRHLVMHGLAVKKLAPAKGIADVLGIAESDVTPFVEALVAAGDAVSARGSFMLTPRAQTELKDSYADVYAELRGNASFAQAYERFEVVNRDLKQLITDWQTIEVAGDRVPNDHSNVEWDTECIDRLGGLHERAEIVLRDLAAGVPRIGHYTKRLETALDKLDAGEQAYFSAPKVDSYHTVWFELHEDLLRMLGRKRDE